MVNQVTKQVEVLQIQCAEKEADYPGEGFRRDQANGESSGAAFSDDIVDVPKFIPYKTVQHARVLDRVEDITKRQNQIPDKVEDLRAYVPVLMQEVPTIQTVTNNEASPGEVHGQGRQTSQ